MKKEVTLITRHFTTSVTDIDIIQEFLENMAQDGWMLKRVSADIYVFEKCEPKKVRFTIDFFNGTSRKTSKAYTYSRRKEYIELCEDAGWTYVTSGRELMFFYTEDMELAPIKVDDEEKFKQIKQYYIMSEGGVSLCALTMVASIAILIMLISFLFSEEYMYSLCCDISEGPLLFLPYLLLIIFSGSSSIFKFVLFYRKNKKRVADGKPIEYLNYKEILKIKNIQTIVSIFIILYWMVHSLLQSTILGVIMYAIVFVASILFVFVYFNEIRYSKKTSIQYTYVKRIFIENCVMFLLATVVAGALFGLRYNKNILFKQEPTLKLTDMGVDVGKYTDESISDDSRFTLFSDTRAYDVSYYEEDGDEEYGFCMYYEVMNTKYEKVVDIYKKHKLKVPSSKCIKASKSDVSKWNAKEVYYLKDKVDGYNRILVVYNNKVIYISSDYKEEIDYTGKYAQMIRQKLL